MTATDELRKLIEKYDYNIKIIIAPISYKNRLINECKQEFRDDIGFYPKWLDEEPESLAYRGIPIKFVDWFDSPRVVI